MGTQKQTEEYLTLEQSWLLSIMIGRPDITELSMRAGDWFFTIEGKAQNCVPSNDISELLDAGMLEPTIASDSAYVVWRPTTTAKELDPNPFWRTRWPSAAKPEFFAGNGPGMAADSTTTTTQFEFDLPALERIATALEDIAAGVLAIDAKLQRFIADVDGKDPWQSDMAGHHE